MDFYYMKGSPACNAVIMTAEALGVKLNKKLLNLEAGEQLTPEFLKINPQHTIPTIVDYNYPMWESRAIIIYLAEKTGNTDLYPKCPLKRVVVNQRLFFDLGTLHGAFGGFFHAKSAAAQQEHLKKMESAVGILNTFLEGRAYVAGDKLTIADIALTATITAYDVSGFSLNEHKNVAIWYENVKKVVPGFEENWNSCLELKKHLEQRRVQ